MTTEETYPTSLLRRVSWVFAGNIFYAFCQWSLFVVMAKLGNAELVGIFALAQAVAIPIYAFTNLQLRSIQVTDARRRFQFGHYMSLRVLTTAVGFALTLLIGTFAGYPHETAVAVVLMGAWKGLESVGEMFHGQLQFREQMDRIAISLAMRGVASVTGVVVGLVVCGSIAWGLLCVVALWLLVFLFVDIPMTSRSLDVSASAVFRQSWDRERIIVLFWLAGPLAVASLSAMLVPNVPRYVIEHSHGVAPLGIYAALGNLTLIGYHVIAALGQAAAPRIAQSYCKGDLDATRRWAVRLVSASLGLAVFAFVFCSLFAEPLLTLVYKPEYAQHVDVFMVLVGANGLLWVGTSLGFVVTAMQRYAVQVLPHSVNAVATGVCSLVLIPTFGLLGAAWVFAAGNLFLALAFAWIAIVALRRQQVP